MKLLYRIGYYFVGLSLGLVIVSFVFNKKKTTCNYGPNARVIGDLQKKRVRIASSVEFETQPLDSVLFKTMLQRAKVDFANSDTQRDNCKTYRLQSNYLGKIFILEVENCEKYVTVLELKQP